MGLETIFKKAARKVFTLFKDAVRVGTYHSIVDTGFESSDTPYTVSIIAASFEEKDIKYLPFSELIQPQDVKGLVMGEEVPDVVVHSQIDKIDIYEKNGVDLVTYTVVSYAADPMKILYTFLLRKT